MAKDTKRKGISLGWLARKLRAQFLLGIIVSVPIGVTALILIWAFNSIDHLLQPIITFFWGHTVPGVGFGVTIVLIYLIGVIASNIAGKALIRYGEYLLGRIPLVRALYNGIKQIMQSLSSPEKTGFMQVVLVEFPKKGMMAMGFVTNEFHDKSGGRLLSVLIPTAPNPVTGFLQIVREEEVIRTKIPIDEAVRMVVSAGSAAPEKLRDRFPADFPPAHNTESSSFR